MTQAPHPTTSDLLAYIDASPTPYHCVAETAHRLDAAGFAELGRGDRWSLEEGAGYYVVQGGTIVAFRIGTAPAADAGFRMVGAHTDSPNLRVKPVPDVTCEGYQQLGVEVYGGVLTYTWLDRDLYLAGRVVLAGPDPNSPLETRLLKLDAPIVRIPSLAIHLNREIRTDGLKLNEQKHLPPVIGLAAGETPEPGAEPDRVLRRLIRQALDVAPERVLSWDLMLADRTPSSVGGIDGAFVFAPRLDNQGMCHAALLALLDAPIAGPTQVVALYDHEEVGSSSASGAGGALLEDVLRRIAEVAGPGAEAGALPRAIAHSVQISADMAHAVHPNYADRHEPKHMPRLNAGPVIKINAQQRYATDAPTAAVFENLCRASEVPYQKFVNRTDLACGSTIGPISSARLGVATVDVGNPMLSMHSIREQSGAKDPARMVTVMTRFLAQERFFAARG